MARVAEVNRKTKETSVQLTLNLDGTGQYQVDTGLGFFDHMLSLWARHGQFDLRLKVRGDLSVDGHHTVEDAGICLGQALQSARGEGCGLARFGQALMPMDEALAMVAVDVSGRGLLAYTAEIPAARVGDFDTELVEEFLRALAVNGNFTLHVRLFCGKNSHHIIEAIFKGIGLALGQALRLTGGDIPSTKGLL